MTVLRKHGLWLIVATLVGIAGAWLVAAGRPVLYSSTAQVDVEPHVVANTTPITPNMGTEAQVVSSGVVLASTARAVGVTQRSLETDLSASVSGTANVLSISCTMPTPAMAQRCAAAAAAAYVDFRNLAGGSKSARAQDPMHVTLVTTATRPAAPAGPHKRILLPLGAMLGLALGIGAVLVRDHFDDRVRDRADLERCLDAPVLAAIPCIRHRRVKPAFVFCRAPFSRAAEAYRYLRSRVQPLLTPTRNGGTVLLVTGAQALEGRTCVAANMAAALAHADTTVILVDADLRHPSLSKIHGAGERPGLTDLLAARATLEEVAVPTDVPGLRLVAGGMRPAATEVADTLEPVQLARAFAGMRAAADVVIVDSAPVLAVSDAINLARVSDIVMMVADVRRTGRGAASAAVREIRAIGQETVVGVLNGVPSLANGGARPSVTPEPRSLASPHQVPAMLASAVPPRGPNGQHRGRFDATPARRHRRADTGTDTGDSPGPGPEPG
jgi:Mrp family chromosome partitioning ATPase/capsular polysaccharide biosynthesis protein